MQRNIHHHLSAEERAFALGSRVGGGGGGGERSTRGCSNASTCTREIEVANRERPLRILARFSHGAPPPHPTPPPTTGCECGRLGGLLSDCGLPPRAVDHADARGRLRPHVCGRHPTRMRRTALGAHGAGVLATGKKETKKSKHTKNKTTQPNAQETLEKAQKAPTDHPQPTLSPRPESRPDPARALILETKKRTTNSLPLDAPPFELPLSPPPLVVRRLCDRRRVRFRAPRSDALGMCVHSTRQGNSIPDMWGKRGCDIWGKGGVSANEKKSARVKTHALP